MTTSAITCQICEKQVHVIKNHLNKEHEDWDIGRYQAEFPSAPLLSGLAEQKLQERRDEIRGKTAKSKVINVENADKTEMRYMHEVFGLGEAPAAMNAGGKPISISMGNVREEDQYLIPDKDPNYVFNINLLKTVMMGIMMNEPELLWGHSGTGKTTLFEQMCAYTKRAFQRVQHTVNTEEADILGRTIVKEGKTGSITEFQLGPLPLAMLHGQVYCADEYDFALPHVLSVYQSVLEGKALVIKEANMRIDPAPGFRFVATGNTNGVGDASGLYSGTQIQNSANYERFTIVEKVEYMEPADEITILMGKTSINKKLAKQMVDIANQFRSAYDRKDLSSPMSPRSLLGAVRLGLARGDLSFGFKCAYINRLNEVSAEVAHEILQRHLGATA